MPELLLHSQTRIEVENFISSPGHSLIIAATAGSGKSSLGTYIGSQLLDVPVTKLDGHAYVLRIRPTKNSISIDEIRSAQQFIKHKTKGDKKIRRILMVEQADLLTTEAQNAFLKLLEEPPTDTVIILTSSSVNSLLPTIRSRAQYIHVNNLSEQQLSSHFISLGFDENAVKRAQRIGEGKIGLVHEILAKGNEHPLLVQIDEAKKILGMSQYERLTKVDELARQKENLPDLLNALQTSCHAALAQASTDNPKARRWHQALKNINEAQNNLTKSPNTKLLLTDMLLNL